MAKTKISEFDSTAANNTDINSINIAEGCPPSTINNAIRELMAQIKNLQAGSSGDTIPLTAGGTGATTASGARTNLGLGELATKDDIVSSDIPSGAVTADKLATNSVTTVKIADANVTSTKLATDSVTSDKIAADAVGASEIAAGAVGSSELATNAVTTVKITDANVTTAKLANSSVTSAKIAANNVTADELNVSGDGTSGQALLSDGDGSFSWGSKGKVLQTVIYEDVNPRGQSCTNNTWTLHDTLRVTITPQSSSSKILIMVNIGKCTSNSNSHGFQIRRGLSTVVTQGAATGSRPRVAFHYSRQGQDGNHASGVSFAMIDSPATTSATTYYLYFYPEGSIFYTNRNDNYADNSLSYSSISTSNIILMEIAD